MRKDLGRGAWYDYTPSWLAGAEAARLLTELTAQVAWEQRPIRMFGKDILQPRLIGWAGELPYRYSGQTLPPRPMVPALQTLSERVGAEVGVAFNHVLLNRYRDGQDHMGRHADDEPELGPQPVIAAVSVGAHRRFRMERKGKRLKRTLDLRNGSLLVMGGTMQHTWYHALLKEPACVRERINVTFRAVMGPPGWRAAASDPLTRS